MRLFWKSLFCMNYFFSSKIKFLFESLLDKPTFIVLSFLSKTISEATKINESVNFVILYYIWLKSLACWDCIATHPYCVFSSHLV